jgi:splicing factor 3A subunit 1
MPGMVGLGFGDVSLSSSAGDGYTEMEQDDSNNEFIQPQESFNNTAPPPPPPSIAEHRSLSAMNQVDEEEDKEIDYDPEIKVVSNYVPRMAAGSAAPLTMVDPITGKVMPVDEMSEHMRIQLLDPRWRIEQQRFQDKQKDTGFAEGDSIADSLKQFARKRGDIFGSDSSNNQIEKKIKPDVASEADVESTWSEHEKNQIAQLQLQQQQHQYKLQMAQQQQQQQIRLIEPIVAPTSIPSYPIPTSIPPPIVHIPPPAQQLLPTSNASYIPAIPVPVVAPTPQQWLPPPAAHIPPPAVVPPANFVAPPAKFVPPPAREIVKSGPILIPCDEFYSNNPGEITFLVNIPNDQSNEQWNLNGQTLSIQLPNVMSSVKDAKDLISKDLSNIPHNKYQLKEKSTGFLKDASNFASLNICGGTLEFQLKSRGGKR